MGFIIWMVLTTSSASDAMKSSREHGLVYRTDRLAEVAGTHLDRDVEV